jgi:demethylmenaquinone methyltransferase/2-methoxy-6-polyprenyl-1,4-benzoquinol methylase
MFASIARQYDLLNHLLSLNIDRSWRRFTVRHAPPMANAPVLDCCTGTADLALEYARAAPVGTKVVGTDFCRPMLEIGRRKIARAGRAEQVALIEGDAHRLPLPDNIFGVVSVAFGLRNVSDTVRGLDEMIRVARPGGCVAVLEFSKPRGRVWGRLYSAFFRHVLPRVGQAIAPNRDSAYAYLPASVFQFPEGEALLAVMAERGLTDLQRFPLTGGIATLYLGTKPDGRGRGAGDGG